MAPNHHRQILVWSLPAIAILLSYLWFRKKRLEAETDPHCSRSKATTHNQKSIKEELEEAILDTTDGSSPNRSFSRSLSGVDSAPIDIIVPKSLRSQQKTNPVVISDEDLDFEIQKIKSMRSGGADTCSRTPSTVCVGSKKSPTVEDKKASVEEEEEAEEATASPPITPKFKSPKVIKCTPQKVILSASASPMAHNKNINKAEENFGATKMEVKENKNTKKRSNGSEDKNIENDARRQSAERDSANHSPSDVMLASPSLSSISDNQSEVASLGSNDSGKGGSDVATPTSRTPAREGSIPGDVSKHVTYEFAVPQHLVGRLIGRGGCIISEIKEKSGTRITIKKHHSNAKLKVCQIEGLQVNIDKALEIIRDKFPLKRYPDVTLEQIQYPPVALTPDQLHLKLIEGVNNDTIVSCMVDPHHFFLQQPTHPTFLNLNVLSNCMNMCYRTSESPLLPTPILESTVCAAQMEGDWYRVMVVTNDEETNTSHVMFLDYGGYAYIENSKLRQIRGDFLLLPFQAAECVLANVKPIGEDGKWSDEAFEAVAEITKGALAYTQVADYTKHGTPLVLMYVLIGPQQIVFLNEELVKRGLAEWIPLPSGEGEGAVGGVES